MPSRDINKCHPTLRARFKAATRLLEKTPLAKRYRIKISCTLRSNEEQMALYAKGRTTPGRIVTYCDGVIDKSLHQADKTGFSRAIDFFLVRKGKAIWRFHPAMFVFIKKCEEVGLEAGYRWSWKDSFHIQMKDSDS